MQYLKDKVAVVTGGNSGIGKATARLFAEEGAQVVITGRRRDIVDQAVGEIGHGAVGVVGDVADLEHHRTLAETVKSRLAAWTYTWPTPRSLTLVLLAMLRRRTMIGTSPSIRAASSSACKR